MFMQWTQRQRVGSSCAPTSLPSSSLGLVALEEREAHHTSRYSLCPIPRLHPQFPKLHSQILIPKSSFPNSHSKRLVPKASFSDKHPQSPGLHSQNHTSFLNFTPSFENSIFQLHPHFWFSLSLLVVRKLPHGFSTANSASP